MSVDGGKPFDWGKTSKDYAKYRDVYPLEFYSEIVKRNLCISGQSVLDIGTGTGVLPRNMYSYGGKWVGADASKNQIEQARILSVNKDIKYVVSSAEDLAFSDNEFDVVTACQCFWYFNHSVLAPKIYRFLKKNGKFVVLVMNWLPFEDKIAAASEKLVLKYNPLWSGCNERVSPIEIPICYNEYFDLVYHNEIKMNVHFTREGWNGRMKSCRGVGASLTANEISAWEREHLKMLNEIAPPEFNVCHYMAIAELKAKK